MENHVATLYKLAGFPMSVPPGPATLVASLGGRVRFAQIELTSESSMIKRSPHRSNWSVIVPWGMELPSFTWATALGLAQWYAECARLPVARAELARALVMPVAALDCAIGHCGYDATELASVFCVPPEIARERMRTVQSRRLAGRMTMQDSRQSAS
jgi:hypothetical protein